MRIQSLHWFSTTLQYTHRNDACVQGGRSILLDAFPVLEEMRRCFPIHFATLVRVPATFQKIHYDRYIPLYMQIGGSSSYMPLCLYLFRPEPVEMKYQRPHVVVDTKGKVSQNVENRVLWYQLWDWKPCQHFDWMLQLVSENSLFHLCRSQLRSNHFKSKYVYMCVWHTAAAILPFMFDICTFHRQITGINWAPLFEGPLYVAEVSFRH